MHRVLMHKYFLMAVAALLPGISFAQRQASTATARGSATVSAPITVSQSQSMTFSSIVVSPNQGGSIVLDPNGKESPTGGVSITNNNNNESSAPASFTVSGQGGYTYSINLPKDPVSMDDSSANLLNITSFTSSPEVSNESQSGTQTINVGATLNIEKAEEPGEFEAEIPFDIRVNYN